MIVSMAAAVWLKCWMYGLQKDPLAFPCWRHPHVSSPAPAAVCASAFYKGQQGPLHTATHGHKDPLHH